MIPQSSKLSVLLLSAAALLIGSWMMLCPVPAYAQGGVPLWTNSYHGPGSGAAAGSLAVDSSGNVFVTGNSLGVGSFEDFATIKYSNAGLSLWTAAATSS